MSFVESSFFPIPPDVMLAPMCLANPARAWRLALITTLASVAGRLFGYALGYFAFDAIEPWLRTTHYWPAYQTSVVWFEKWGFWAILVAGLSPIPYKVFTLAAGALSMALLPFTLASIIGRGLRFFMVAGLMAWGGARMDAVSLYRPSGLGDGPSGCDWRGALQVGRRILILASGVGVRFLAHPPVQTPILNRLGEA